MKYCIFCGNSPSNKNKEHVVPRWLIELTGNPKRIANFGFDMSLDNALKSREFAFDQFTFPACESCNTNHSKLENETRQIIIKILNKEPISADEISILLNWFDKVRVGLWLGFNQLDKNILDIEPNFHINKRIGQFDRILIIERSVDDVNRLNFTGCQAPAFTFTPSAFSLTVNNVHFTNVSFAFLFSRRLGFPYPIELQMCNEQNALKCDLQPGRERIMRPLIKRIITEKGTKIYQPMFPQDLMSDASQHYESEYVRKHSLCHKLGAGGIFIEQHEQLPYHLNTGEKIVVNPDAIYGEREQAVRTVINICKWQNWINDTTFTSNKLDIDSKKYVKSRQKLARVVNETLIKHHEDLLIKWGYL